MLGYFRTAIYNPWRALQGEKVITVTQDDSEDHLGTTDGHTWTVSPSRVK